MAARRFYAYYIRGRKIALIEHDNVSGSGQTLGQPSLDDIGPSGGLQWKSPIASVTDGIEIEYAYSPRYIVPPEDIRTSQFFINGWTTYYDNTEGVDKTYLAFLRTEEDGIAGWSNAPTSLGVDDNFVIRGSARWNGLHKVKSLTLLGGATGGILTTYTEINNVGTQSLIQNAQTDFNGSDQTVYDGGSGYYLADLFPAGGYVWISGATTGAQNNGLFSISSVTQSNTAISSKITLGTRYSVVQSDDSDTYATGLSNEYSAAANLNTEAMGSSVYMIGAHRDFCYMVKDVDLLEDESDTIDLPEYLSKALVYYVQAKRAEDRMELDQKEYFMREFRRILEKHESSKIWGSRQTIAGPHSIR